MAELATIARPYAEALFKASDAATAPALAREVQQLAAIAGDARLRGYAADPKVTPQQVVDLIGTVVDTPLSPSARNLLQLVLENGRLAALPDVAAQFNALVNARSGVSDATVFSAYPIEPARLADVQATLEKRFGRRLNATVVVQPELIGGIRVVVGDEVLDTSVKARLEQMKAALTA